MAPSAPDPDADALEALRRPLAGRRLLSWGLLLLLLAGFALVPLLLSQKAAKAQAAARPEPPDRPLGAEDVRAFRTALAWDRVWDAGPLDSAHAALSLDCRACHAEPFVRVRDEDCTACHRTVAAHGGASPPIAGEAAPRCASCHREHHGPMGLQVQNLAHAGGSCIDCHDDLAARRPELGLLDASDFAAAHPEFAVRLDDGSGVLVKRRLGEGPVSEPTGLKFPHDVHLAASGIGGPDGRERLDCGSCHRLRPDALGFEPVRFASDCQACHALHLEGTFARRSVPHGPLDEALSMIREFYGFAASLPGGLDAHAAGGGAVQRPGGSAPRPRQEDALALARQEAIDLVERRGCAVCHEVTRVAETGRPGTPAADLPEWRIAAVPLPHPWMPGARFSHAAHTQMACVDCHAAESSKAASEVLMPGIAGCRDCHAGARAAPGMVRSDCGLCHDYHPAHAALQASERLFGRVREEPLP